MYLIDKDVVLELIEVPQHDPGAPNPVVLADDGAVVLAYFAAPPHDGDTVYVKFLHCRAHYFGAPNDEALQGHPLYDRGLKQYAIAEVKNSSWIKFLERMNSVHPHHRPERFARLRHFVFTFHDSIFECVAEGFESSMHVGDCDVLSERLCEFFKRA